MGTKGRADTMRKNMPIWVGTEGTTGGCFSLGTNLSQRGTRTQMVNISETKGPYVVGEGGGGTRGESLRWLHARPRCHCL